MCLLCVFLDWLVEKGLDTNFEKLDDEALCNLLRRFYGEIVTKEGESYSRNSLLGPLGAIQRYLIGETVQRVPNIFSGTQFKAANSVLTGKIRKMKKEGCDASKSHPAIAESDIKLMYSTKTLCDDNPTSLQLKVYYESGLHFGRRGKEGLRELKKTDIKFKRDEIGGDYATL